MTFSSLAPERIRAWVCALALASAPAWAQDPVAPERPAEAAPGAPAPGEIIVYGDLEIARARADVIRDLKALGYKGGKRKDGYTLYRPESPWRPSVRVYDDGFIVLKRTPPRFMPPGDPNKKINYLWCVPPFTPMCLRIGGVVVSKRKLQPQKARVANALEPELRDWRAAVAAKALAERVGETLPDQLDALWGEGVSPDPSAPRVVSPTDRRAAILELWRSRTCTPEGAQVREVVALFLAFEVQASPFPVTRAEASAAQAGNLCGARLDLPFPGEGAAP